MTTFLIKNLGLFIDFENIHSDAFDLDKLIHDLSQRGRVIKRRAFADWGRYSKMKQKMMVAGVELIEMPAVTHGGKNGSDIKLTIDVMDTVYDKPHIDTFVLVTGDSDFTPLVMNLREKNRYVIVVSGPDNTSRILQGCCDEFLDISEYRGAIVNSTELQGCYHLLQEVVAEIRAMRPEVLSSMVKSRMLHRDPMFSELEYGFRQFRQFLQQAENDGIIHLKKRKDGEYKVTLQKAFAKPILATLGPVPTTNGRPGTNEDGNLDHLISVIVSGVALSRNGDNKTTLNELARSCKRLAGDLPPQQFGVSEQEGFKGLVRVLHEEGFLDLEETTQPSRPTISLTEKGEAFHQDNPKQDRYVELQYLTCLENSPFPARLQHIKVLHESLRTVLDDAKPTAPTVADFLQHAQTTINTISKRRIENLLQALIDCEAVQMQQVESFDWETGLLTDLEPLTTTLERVVRQQRQCLADHLEEPIRWDLFQNLLIWENRNIKLIDDFAEFLSALDLR